MSDIRDIWKKSNEQISNDKSLNTEFIINSISESSIGITSKLPKIIWFGIVFSMASVIVFLFNVFYYFDNKPVIFLISSLSVIALCVLWYLLAQLKTIRQMDIKDADLKSLLVYKLKYLNNRFQFALHCVAFTVVLVTFSLNLTMENSDGVFEFRKILILSVFYVFVYVFSVCLYKLIHSVYIRQLENALNNLEENTFRDFNEELKKHKRLKQILGVIFLIVFLTGIVFFLKFI